MATPVPPSTKPIPAQYKPLPPAADLYEPDDYREAFGVHSTTAGISKVCPTFFSTDAVLRPVPARIQGQLAVSRTDAL